MTLVLMLVLLVTGVVGGRYFGRSMVGAGLGFVLALTMLILLMTDRR